MPRPANPRARDTVSNAHETTEYLGTARRVAVGAADRIQGVTCRGTACAIVLAVLLIAPAAAETFVVALVDDGPSAKARETREPYERELLALTEGEFEVQFRRFEGDWTRDGILSALDRAYADSEVDIVLVLGLVGNQIVGLQDEFPKATFLPRVFAAGLLGLPRAGSGSGKANLSYLSDDLGFAATLESFLSVAPFKRLGLLVDGIILEAVGEIDAETRRVAKESQVEIVSIPYFDPEQDLVALIPPDVEAVMIGGLARLDEAAMQRLVDGLIARQLPSFSFLGDEHVQAGLLTTNALNSDLERLTRRTALNMQAVLLGERAEDLPVDFERKRRLFINMKTARALDVWPRFDILVKAVMFELDGGLEGPLWTLADVALAVVEQNLDLLAQRHGTEAGVEEIRQARANLRPQISSDLNRTQLNGASPSVAAGVVAQSSTTVSLTVSQLLWSEPVRAAIDIQREVQRSREAELEQLRLDVVQLATVAFFDVLRVETQFRVQRDNLHLSRANLELARDRVRVGSANASDVYRWESQGATDQQNAIAARTSVVQARENLNRILNRPLAAPFRLIPSTLDDPALLMGQGDLRSLIDNPKAIQQLMEYLVERGLERSPELAALRPEIAAKKREILSERRSSYWPAVSLQGELSRVLEEDREAGFLEEAKDDWSLGLVASLSLFEGGARGARIEQAQFELRQLEVRYESARDQVEQGIRSGLHLANASLISIPLAEKAAEAARRSLELVTDSYSQGAVGIIDLLDAQSAVLQASEGAANAVHNFLIDLMNLQRATSRFDFFLNEAERETVLQELRATIVFEGSDDE